jgi:4'-phosphopantetheinyl transferase
MAGGDGNNRSADDVAVWVVRLDPLPVPQARLEALLDDGERARARALMRVRDRDRFVASHAALRCVLGALLDAEPAGLSFATGERGKPRLAHGGPRFNLSRSHDLALVAVAADREIGVDVERVAPRGDEQLVAERFLEPGEAELLRGLAGEAHTRTFFRLWSAREAIAKAAGSGIAAPPQDERWSVTRLDVDPGYEAALAAEGPPPEARVVRTRWATSGAGVRIAVG